MGFLQRLFFNNDPLASIRRALEQKRWAEALAIATGIDQDSIAPEARSELNDLLITAGDGLAEMNLFEGGACLRAGDVARASEHFTLAAGQACSAELRNRVMSALVGINQAAPPTQSPSEMTKTDCHASCTASCGSPGAEEKISTGAEFDLETHIELIVSSYPEELANRYLQLDGSFRDAFLLAHEGNVEEAVQAFGAVPERDRGDLFYFERGALHARSGKDALATADLEKALELNPDHLLAMETLVLLKLTTGDDVSAERHLRSMLARNIAPSFCHGNLAGIFARRGDPQAALDHGLQAIRAGETSTEALLLTASLLEEKGRQEEAEKVLSMIHGGGCSGGPNLALAEFWLRHEKNLDKILTSFKGALRSEPDNPRWLLRIAQVYLAHGWNREGVDLLEKTLAAENLDPLLHAEGVAILNSRKK